MSNVKHTTITLCNGVEYAMEYSTYHLQYEGKIYADTTIVFTLSFTNGTYVLTSQPEVVKELADEIKRIILKL